MKILLIDTSTKNLSLAVSEGVRILRYRNIQAGRSLSSVIIPEIKKILENADTTLEVLDGFAVGLGPGAFTGLRVGLAMIKGLAFATNKPVVGVSSLHVVAMGSRTPGPVCVISDARRKKVYACFYENKKSQGEMVLTDIQAILNRIKQKTIFIGDGIKVFEDEIQRSEKMDLIQFAEEKLWLPQARHMPPLVVELFKKKAFDDIEKLVPLYLYPEDCQVRRP